MEFNTIFEHSYNYLDSLIVSIKNQFYDVFIDLQDDEEEAESNCSLLNETNNSEKFDIEEEAYLPMIMDELNNDDVIECEEDENLNQHNTAFVLDSSQIDWNEPQNDAYYDPHDDCVEYPNFLHNYNGSYGSNYDGGYDSH
jgi:hypothetical protein